MAITKDVGKAGHETDLRTCLRQQVDATVRWKGGTYQSSLLHYACDLTPSIEAAAMLVDAGADVDATDDARNTALHVCANHGTEKHVTIARSLLAHGADPVAQNSAGHTALDDAQRAGNDTMRLLLVLAAAEHAQPAPPPRSPAPPPRSPAPDASGAHVIRMEDMYDERTLPASDAGSGDLSPARARASTAPHRTPPHRNPTVPPRSRAATMAAAQAAVRLVDEHECVASPRVSDPFHGTVRQLQQGVLRRLARVFGGWAGGGGHGVARTRARAGHGVAWRGDQAHTRLAATACHLTRVVLWFAVTLPCRYEEPSVEQMKRYITRAVP